MVKRRTTHRRQSARARALALRRKASQARTNLLRGAELGLELKRAQPAAFPEITDPKKILFLQALAESPRLGRAARAAGVCQKTAWNWRADLTDTVFQEAVRVALKLGIENLEAEFIRRGFEGYIKPVYHQGELVGATREFDTTAGIFMLKALDPERHRETFRHEHGGPQGGPIEHRVEMVELSEDEIERRFQNAKRVIDALAVPTPALPPALSEPTPEERYAQELARRKNGGSSNGQGGHS